MSGKLLLYVVGGIISSIASLTIGAIFGDKIKLYWSRILHSFSESQRGIEDIWLANFVVTRDGKAFSYSEVVRIRLYYGVLFGNIEPDSRNYAALQGVQEKRPLRMRGELKDNSYFTGYWYHPIDTARFHGAFQLVLHPDGTTMSGRWVGYSETLREIDAGEWHFTRLSQKALPLSSQDQLLIPSARHTDQEARA